MKCALGFLLGMAAAWQSAAAGLIIVHDADFWHRPPEVRPIPPFPPPRPPVPPPRPHPPRPRAWAPLEVALVKAEVRIQDQVARTDIEQEFYNPNNRQLEGTFLFPVPRGAHIDKFTLEINGQPVEAELLGADKARGIYEDIVRKLRDPALLEYAGRDLFKARIFPIEPHRQKRITLAYTHLLKADAGLLSYVLPLDTEKFSAQPLGTVSVKVRLESPRPLKAIYSPSHPIAVKRSGEHEATVDFEARQVKPDRDFQLFFAPEEGEFGLSLLTHKPGDDGHFLLLVSPSAESKSVKIIPKDIAFVIDTSGSMAGAKLNQAKKALRFCIANLNAEDRFEVLRFSTEVEPLFNGLVDASREHGDRADAFINDLKPIGGTAIDAALQRALALRPESGNRPYVIIFLTDGRPTVGETDENTIVAKVTRQSEAQTRIFCFGIGTDVNTHLLDKVTEETHACSQYVLPEEDIEVKVSSFYTRIKEPVLAGLKLAFPEGVRVTQVYPTALPDLFKGEQLVVAGRYSGHGRGNIEITGTAAGEIRRFRYPAEFAARTDAHEFVPRLWATRRVGYLLDEIRLRGESQELKDEVTELARRYGIVTPYTAYLILEDEGQRRVAQRERTLHFAEPEARQQLAASYDALRHDRSGDLAVGSARSAYVLKSAQAPAEAIISGQQEAFRGLAIATQPVAVPPATVPAPGGGGTLRSARQPVVGNRAGLNPAYPAPKDQKADAYAAQTKYVRGRAFYLNGTVWVDATVQKHPDAPRVRVQFSSAEYFDLLKKHPEASAWLAVGSNLQIFLGQTVYEIFP